MINALHLFWIIPLSASAGAFCMALAAAGRTNNIRKRLKSYENTGLTPAEIKALFQDCV